MHGSCRGFSAFIARWDFLITLPAPFQDVHFPLSRQMQSELLDLLGQQQVWLWEAVAFFHAVGPAIQDGLAKLVPRHEYVPTARDVVAAD
jgi:hypothetical protein